MTKRQKKISKEFNNDKIAKDVQATSDEASRLLAGLETSSNAQNSSQPEDTSDDNRANIYKPTVQKNQHSYQPSNPKPESPDVNAGYMIVGIIVVGLTILISVISSTSTQVRNFGGSQTQYDSTALGSIPYGKARYKSGRTGKTELIGVKISRRSNTNGHITYDAFWADGYESSYVFWKYGRAEIFSKNGAAELERTKARYRRASNGDCVITADTNAVTTFPNFTPAVN